MGFPTLPNWYGTWDQLHTMEPDLKKKEKSIAVIGPETPETFSSLVTLKGEV